MNCPKCGYEPRDRLLHKPCPKCAHVWVDTESYVNMLTEHLTVDSALDIGCGNKGVIAQYHWENVHRIKQGYACDRHVIKALPPLWTPLKMDAEGLVERLGVDGVDFTTHCGMLEHVSYAKALRILRVVEQVTKKRVFATCSTVLREVDYKVKRDGNPYHYYKSFWDAEVFNALGYHCDVERMVKGETFRVEIAFWFDPPEIKQPFEDRLRGVIEAFRKRSLLGCYACNDVAIGWDPCLPAPHWFCDKHADPKIASQERQHFQTPAVMGEDFPYPPTSMEQL
jgi:hypothetical protein